jgi:organic radical activating enzyme
MNDIPEIDHRQLYRLPWTLPDNAIVWLEPTSACNLACDGCYRENVSKSHKTLSEVREDLKTFRRLRIADGVSIAGGDPLMHPQILDIVEMVAEMGMKPIINTNGGLLTKEMLVDLKRAGAFGFTFHIDSKQGRPKWKDKNELDLNELRLHFAEMLAEVGGLSCAFNSTVYDDTLQYVPEMVAWAEKHIDIVNVMVFILYRAAVPALPFDWYAGGKKIDMNQLVYSETSARNIAIQSPEVVSKIRTKFPEFTPCAYLNGTEKPDSFKWLLTGRLGSKKDGVLGYTGPKFMEIIQAGHHLLKGRYLAYSSPQETRLGRTMLLLSLVDKGIRKIAGRYLKNILTKPWSIFRRLHYQSVMIIQPVDFMPNGGQNMCDGCPDVTVWNNEIVWSCRLEELKNFGCWVRSVPKDK